MRKRDVILILVVMLIIIISYNKFKEKRTALTTLELNDSSEIVQQVSDEQDAIYNQSEITRRNAITGAVELIEPAVVSVNVIKTQVVRRYMNPFENPFFGFFDNFPQKRQVKSIGSGVIFTEDGYILTNGHVVEGATKIKVILSDGGSYDADLIGLDRVHDIAVLKISGKKFHNAKLGCSSDLIIGEWSIAVGNPYGFLIKDSKPSVSVGVISAVNRDFAENKQGKIYRRMIQTDCAINPGNSGGPLVNIFGEIIGLNTFIFSESGGSIGIGFAIPIDRVKKIAGELIKYGKVRDIWFGFKVQDINPMLASYMNLDNKDGVIVVYIETKGPAAKSGLMKGDIIKEINKTKIIDIDDAELAITDVSVGDVIKLKVLRDKKIIALNIDAIEYK